MVIAVASMLDRVLYGLLVVLVGWPCDVLRRLGLQWAVEVVMIDSHRPQHAKYLLAYLLPFLLVRLAVHRALPVRWVTRARVALLCMWVWCWLSWNGCYAMDGAIAYRYEHEDGLVCTMLLMNGLVEDFNFAARLDGRTDPFSTQMYLPMPPRRTSTATFFTCGTGDSSTFLRIALMSIEFSFV